MTLAGITNLAPGTSNLKVQVTRKTRASNTGNCSIYRWSHSRARFFIDLVP